ncbi:hypothetical protein K502DRAFT_278224, partial [Neoconidiobolus thromboides FSU 785]
LDYSKWDNIELSDDEDIEVHPNVDKKSFIKWNQEAIHRRRAERKQKIDSLKQRITFCDQMMKKMKNLMGEGENSFGMEEMKTMLKEIAEKMEKSKKGGEERKEGEMSIEQSLMGLFKHIEEEVKSSGEEMNRGVILEKLKVEFEKVKKHQEDCREELKKEEKIESNTLTSENICKPGFDKTIVSKSNEEQVKKELENKKKQNKKEKQIEILNPKTLTTNGDGTEKGAYVEEEEEDIETSDEANEFSNLKTLEQSLEFISKYKFIINEKYSDEILAKGFELQLQGNSRQAKHCVHQALIIQYCGRLGKDGVTAFFKRITTTGNEVFLKDVEDTYNILKQRCEVIRQQNSKQKAIFQLEPTSEDAKIMVDLPTDDINDQERKVIFNSLPLKLQEALKENTIEAINLALSELDEQEAEHALQLCDQGAFLNFLIPGE